MKQIHLGDITIDIELKDIKNIHLSVYPPHGNVRISAPLHTDVDTLRVYALSKLNWIKKQQKKICQQVREEPREFIDRESHYYNGKRYLLTVIETNAAPKVVLKHSTLELYIRPDSSAEKCKMVLEKWYRSGLKAAIPVIIAKWEKEINVQVAEFGIKKMKTKWGTCNPKARRIWLNLELAKKPPEYLEYVIVHEMVHFLERHHNDRFVFLMNQYLPKWSFYREELNRLPVKHEEWGVGNLD